MKVWVADGRIIPVIMLSTIEIQFMEVDIVGAEIHYFQATYQSMSYSITVVS